MILLANPLPAKAEVPSGVFGFMDGKYYDMSSILKYFCLMDNNCYDLQGNLAFKRTPVAEEEPEPTLPDYDQPFTAEITRVVNLTSARVELEITLKLQDGTKLSNQTIRVDNKTPGTGFYIPYQTDSNGTFDIDALFDTTLGLILKIKYNDRYFTVTMSRCELRLPGAVCA